MFLLRMVLICLALFLSLGGGPCCAGGQDEPQPRVVYFDFSVDNGETWQDSADYQTFYCSVQSGKTGGTSLVLFCSGEVSNNYRGSVDGGVYEELTRLVSDLGLDGWAAFGSGMLYSGRPEWALTILYQDGRQVKAGGLLEGKIPENFKEAERAIALFFRQKAEASRNARSRQIESFSFETGPEAQALKLYSVHVSLNQRSVIVMLHDGDEKGIVNFFIDQAAFDEFSALVSKYASGSWHAFRGVQDGSPEDFRMLLKYDTFETVEVQGNSNLAGGAPEGFGVFAGALTAYFDKYRRMFVQSQLQEAGKSAEGLSEFFFSVSGAAKADHQSYQVSRVLTPLGMRFAMTAEKFCDDDLTVEFVLSDDEMARLEALGSRLNLEAWDGFRGYRRGVRDGSGFTLMITFADREVRARGYAAFPPDYAEKSGTLLQALDQIAEAHRKVKTSTKYPAL